MHYEIRRGHQTGKPLTQTQRSSGTFAEEPIVLGKVMRRGSSPIRLTPAQFEQQKAKLLRQLLSGSIEIYVVDANKTPARLDYKTARGLTSPLPVEAGDAPPPAVLAPAAKPKEELEAAAPPPSSDAGEPTLEPSVELETQPPETIPEPDPEPEAPAAEAPKRRSKKEQA
jgi:hypothetical protein